MARIIGAHSIIYSTSPVADRDFLRDVLHLPHVDVGEGWLIFALPPSEVAVHPSDENEVHELYLMCDDLQTFIGEMGGHGIACGPVHNAGWGLLTQVTLPGGGRLGVYQPRHARPEAARPRTTGKKVSRRSPSKSAKKAKKKKGTRR